MLISIIGLVLIYDSIVNFGIQFGYRWDDSKYFYDAKEYAFALLDGKFYLIGVYQTIVAINILIIHFLSLGLLDVELIHVIPLNWFLTSYIIVLSGQLVHLITKYRVNHNLLLLSTIGNFVFFDSLTRLYRESIIMFCILLTFVLFIQHKKINTFIPLTIAFLVRGANGLLGLFFLVFLRLSQIVKKRMSFNLVLIISGILIILTIYSTQFLSSSLIYFASDITRKSTREIYEGYSIADIIKARTKFHLTREGRGETLRFVYEHGGFTGSIIRIFHSILFPIRFTSPKQHETTFHSVEKSGYVYDAFFLYMLIRNIHIILLPIFLPLFVFGFYDLMNNNNYTKFTVIYYIFALFLTTFISLQIRHYLAFIILHPIIIISGYNHFVRKRKLSLMKLFSFITLIIIISYNIIQPF